MERTKLIQGTFFAFIIVTFISGIFGSACFAADEEKPERFITMAAEYPGVEIPIGEDVTMDVIFYNKGKRDAGSFWWEWWPKSSNWECRDKVSGLASGEHKVLYCAYTFTSLADYNTKVILDSEYEIDESDEGNNVLTKPIVPDEP